MQRALRYSKSLINKRFGKDRRKEDFDTFLTNSPLFDPNDPLFESVRPYNDGTRLDGLRTFKDEGVYPEYLGSYHIQHRIDGKLVAVNVCDITEQTLGSIYTYYDPQYEFLSLGTITAIREIEYMKRIREKYNPKIKYYYMGYYVHSCPKTSYKENMHPQNLLCPITYTYVQLTPELKQRLIAEKYFKFDESKPKIDLFNLEYLMEFVRNFKFIYERNRWLKIHALTQEFKEEFIIKIGAIYKTIGEMFLNKFLFEFQ